MLQLSGPETLVEAAETEVCCIRVPRRQSVHD